MDDLTARKQELYHAYDEAALRILMDRYGEEQGDRLLAELRALPAEEGSVPAGEERAVEETLKRCTKKKRAAALSRAALRSCAKVAAVLLVLGSLASYAAFTASAHQEKQAERAASGYALPEERHDPEEAFPGESDREERRDEVQKTAD